MSNDCLLLNGNGKPVSYFPLSTIDWKTAIRLLITKNIIVIIKTRHIREYAGAALKSNGRRIIIIILIIMLEGGEGGRDVEGE